MGAAPPLVTPLAPIEGPDCLASTGSCTSTASYITPTFRQCHPRRSRLHSCPARDTQGAGRARRDAHHRTTVQPEPVAPQSAPSRRNTGSSGGTAYYKNCDAARAAGAAPIKVGEPGYRSGLDGDNDGTACE